jgi:hypothetical protein
MFEEGGRTQPNDECPPPYCDFSQKDRIVSMLAELTRLRPMMPFAELSKIVGPEVRPSSCGWVDLSSRFLARIDLDGKIGGLSFYKNYPSTKKILGLHIRMTLDDLARCQFDFQMASQRDYPFKLTPYVAKTDLGDEISVHVDRFGFVQRIDIARPGLIYPKGSITDGVAIKLNPWSYDDDAEMLSDWAASQSNPEPERNFEFIIHADWLMHKASPDDWHIAALETNWDNGVDPLLWIIRQKKM